MKKPLFTPARQIYDSICHLLGSHKVHDVVQFMYIALLAQVFLFVGTGVFAADETLASQDQTGRAKPNIVLILVDDLGYADTGFTGCKDFQTPHIDRLAEYGVVCTNGYASHPFCAPTRAVDDGW